MLGFRSLYRTHDTPELLDVVAQQLFVWLQSKRYNAAALVPGPPVEIGRGVWGTLQNRTEDVGSQTLRAQIVENTRDGAWTSELTAHVSPTGNRGWVWLDVHNPRERGWTGTPRLARALVGTLPARDGAHRLGSRPRRVDDAGVDEVVAALSDPNRRGLAFVAGTADTVPFSTWSDRVADVLHDTVGLANAWILTPTATERFNYRMGRTHGVEAFGLRTYAPAVAVDDPLDAERHRFLTARGLATGSPRVLRRVLGHRAREQMIATPMPEQLRDLERLLRRDSDTALLDALVPPEPSTTEPAPVAPAPIARVTRPSTSESVPDLAEPGEPAIQPAEPAPAAAAASSSTTPELEPAVAPAPDLAAELVALLHGVLGPVEPTVENLARLREAVTAPRELAPTTRDRIEWRFEELRSAVEEAEFDRDLAREEVSGLQREREVAEDEHAETRRRLRHVQLQLAETGRADQAWTEPEVDVRDIRPDSFTDLLSRTSDLDHVVFTGDRATTEDLDDHGNGRTWAGIAWDALLALDDYARASLTEGLDRDVAGYLLHTPAGCRPFPSRRHAQTESNEVQNNPKLRRPRELPVPVEVDAAGVVFMGAHFKLALSATVSPRLHYFDATARTGRVYVGYIGPHLPLGSVT